MLLTASKFVIKSLQQSASAIATLDDRTRGVGYNAAVQAQWGYDSGEVLSRNVKMPVPQFHCANNDQYVDRRRREGAGKIVGSAVELEIERNDGARTWINNTLSQIKVGIVRNPWLQEALRYER